MTTTTKVTETQKRTVTCPRCLAERGRPCRSERIPGASTFGGGWGGAPNLERAHAERREAALAAIAERASR